MLFVPFFSFCLFLLTIHTLENISSLFVYKPTSKIHVILREIKFLKRCTMLYWIYSYYTPTEYITVFCIKLHLFQRTIRKVPFDTING